MSILAAPKGVPQPPTPPPWDKIIYQIEVNGVTPIPASTHTPASYLKMSELAIPKGVSLTRTPTK